MLDAPVRVLLIDDDRDDYVITRDLLMDIPGNQYTLDWVPDFDSGLSALEKATHDVYLIDYRLGERDGLELIQEAVARKLHAPMILMTGQSEWELDFAAMRAGAIDFLEKGRLDSIQLERSIRYSLQQKRLEAELERKVRDRTRELEQEVAERKRVEEQLKAEDRRKDEFLATLAHELRNPLAPIRTSLEIMALAGDNPAALEQARGVLERQVAQMVRLIDDLLDVSRITRGKLRVNLEPVVLADVITSALEMSRPLLEKARLALVLSVPDEPIVLNADRVRLAQVFSNLLNNAAKYTEAGGTVTVRAIHEANGVAVRVRDTGIGIPPEMLPQVFELFSQVDRSLDRAQGGLGIGLALVKRLVEMHGGRCEAHSDGPGQGAEFGVWLPITA